MQEQEGVVSLHILAALPNYLTGGNELGEVTSSERNFSL